MKKPISINNIWIIKSNYLLLYSVTTILFFLFGHVLVKKSIFISFGEILVLISRIALTLLIIFFLIKNKKWLIFFFFLINQLAPIGQIIHLHISGVLMTIGFFSQFFIIILCINPDYASKN